jgi:hypothetical protein
MSTSPWMSRALALAAPLLLQSGCSRAGPETQQAPGPAASECSRLDAERSGALPQVSSAGLRSHLRVLADDALEGRGTGTPGFQLAADYVADCFSRLGLKPAGTQGYLQPVPLRNGRITEAGFILEGPSGPRELVSDRDFIAFPDLARPEVTVTAPLVLAGFGVTASEHGYDDYKTVDARGKIVVILRGGPPSFPPTERAHYATPRMRYENAVRHGAVGVLSISPRSEPAPWELAVRSLHGGTMAWLNPAGRPSDDYPELKARARLSDSSAMRLFDGARHSYDEVLTAA